MRSNTALAALAALVRLLRAQADTAVRIRIAAAVFAVCASALLAALAPLALKGLVDALSVHPTTRAVPLPLWAMSTTYLLALCGSRVLNEVGSRLTGSAEQRLSRGLREKFFAHLLGLPLAFHLGRHAGAVVHSLYQALAGFHIAIGSAVNTLVPVAIELVTVAIVLSSLDQPLLICTFVATGVAYLAIFTVALGWLGRRSSEISDAALSTHATLSDQLANIETIKSLGTEALSCERFFTASRNLESRWVELMRQQAFLGLAVAATFTLSIAASVALTLNAVLSGTMSMGGFVLANLYMVQIVRPLEMFGGAARDLSQAIEFIRPMLDVLKHPHDKPPTVTSPLERVATPRVNERPYPGAPSVRFSGVHFTYDGGKAVFCGLDFDAKPGRNLAIVGASGCGKSSVARLLLGHYRPQFGRILLDEMPIDGMEAAELRSLIGVVPQETALFHDTIAWNIGIGRPGSSLKDIQAAARIAQLDEFVASLPAGYDTVVGERGMRLSGGERQRVAIARALLKRPKMYLFDEATSMLDSQTEGAIVQKLREISEGCTTITIAHRLSTVQHADEIIVLDKGRVSERGRHAGLLASGGAYAELWALQTGFTAI